MSLVFTEGFDWTTNEGLYEVCLYTTPWNSATPFSDNANTSTGRHGGNCVYIYGSSFPLILRCSDSSFLPGAPFGPTITIGFAVAFNENPTYGQNLLVGKSSAGTTQFAVQYNSLKHLTIYGYSTTAVLELNTWYYVEITIVFNDSTGSVVVDIDGVEDINETGIDTAGDSSNLNLGYLEWYGGWSCYIDDFYMRDDSTRHGGDTYVQLILPDGAGNYTQFTPSAGNNYETVDETNLTTADYNSATTVGYKDSFTLGALDTDTQDVYGVAIKLMGKRNVTVPTQAKALIRTNSTDYTSSAWFLGDNWKWPYRVWEQNPDTTSAWSVAEVNALEAGYTYYV
ncbi:MAG: hypothetical protein ACWGQW_01195 [bacterium]